MRTKKKTAAVGRKCPLLAEYSDGSDLDSTPVAQLEVLVDDLVRIAVNAASLVDGIVLACSDEAKADEPNDPTVVRYKRLADQLMQSALDAVSLVEDLGNKRGETAAAALSDDTPSKKARSAAEASEAVGEQA